MKTSLCLVFIADIIMTYTVIGRVVIRIIIGVISGFIRVIVPELIQVGKADSLDSCTVTLVNSVVLIVTPLK